MSTFDRLADLPLTIEGYALEAPRAERLERLPAPLDDLLLRGGGQEGVGRGHHLRRRGPGGAAGGGAAQPLAGGWTLGSFCDHLEALDLWPSRRCGPRRATTASGPTSRPRSTSRCARPASPRRSRPPPRPGRRPALRRALEVAVDQGLHSGQQERRADPTDDRPEDDHRVSDWASVIGGCPDA